MKIAVIGWGSLIWDPRDLDVEPRWRKNGPMLPVEFARFSSRDRLTLVLVEGAPHQPTLWSLSKKESLRAAAEDLRKREGTSVNQIGRWSRMDEASSNSSTASIVAKWAEDIGLDGAVWTALGPNTIDSKSVLVSSKERIEYLKSLVAVGNAAAAREYFEQAPAQIATPLRHRIQEELGWR